jgi:flagellar hook-basal body complex protein FliE
MRIEDNFARNEVLFNSKFNNTSSDKNTAEQTNSASFGDILKKTVDETNDKMVQADSATQSFVRGDDVNIDEVMIKGQEASLSLQFLATMRDKLLDGYNTLSKMQL